MADPPATGPVPVSAAATASQAAPDNSFDAYDEEGFEDDDQSPAKASRLPNASFPTAAAQAEADARERERVEAEQRETQQREAEQREAQQREAQQREAQQREAERQEAERLKAEAEARVEAERARLEAEQKEAERRQEEKKQAELIEAQEKFLKRKTEDTTPKAPPRATAPASAPAPAPAPPPPEKEYDSEFEDEESQPGSPQAGSAPSPAREEDSRQLAPTSAKSDGAGSVATRASTADNKNEAIDLEDDYGDGDFESDGEDIEIQGDAPELIARPEADDVEYDYVEDNEIEDDVSEGSGFEDDNGSVK